MNDTANPVSWADRQRLAGLAAALTQRSDLRIEATDHRWAWQAGGKQLMVASDDLCERGVAQCRGFLAHEAAHVRVSRYFCFDRSQWADPVGTFVMNALEDSRAEHHMASVFPGTKRWLDQTNTKSPEVPVYLATFGFACLADFHSNWSGTFEALPGTVREALQATRPARRRYAETLPPVTADQSQCIAAAKMFNTAVRPHLLEVPDNLDPNEQIILTSAWQAYLLAEAEILPWAQRLYVNDVRQLARCLQLDRNLTARAKRHRKLTRGEVVQLVHQALSRLVPPEMEPAETAVELATSLLDAYFSKQQAEPLHWLEEGVDMRRAPSDRVDYARVKARHSASITRLRNEIEGLLQMRHRARTQTGYDSGLSVNMDAALAAESDANLRFKVWERRLLPSRPSVAVGLLLDLSGSMRSNIKEAIAALIILAETVSRLKNVSLEINGFQDVLLPVWSFGETFSTAIRSRIEDLQLEVHDCATHNQSMHNADGVAVRAASARLLAQPARQRILLVISDGLPDGPDREDGLTDQEDLRQAIKSACAAGIELIGVGIGAGTSHVGDFYPTHLAEVPVDEFALRLGVLMKDLLIRGA